MGSMLFVTLADYYTEALAVIALKSSLSD